MIRSMTAFARAEADLGVVQATWEVRSVNHRYLDIRPHLPEGYRQLEPTVREWVRGQLERGKVDVGLRLGEAGGEGAGLELDRDLAASLVQLADEASRQLGTSGGLTTGELLRWPGVVRTPTLDQREAERRLQEALEHALADLVATREREGAALAEAMRERLETVESGVAAIRNRLPQVRQALRERLETRLQELQQQVDPDRLEQELVLATQRMDVAEELDRLTTHVAEARRVLEAGGPCGRRLDFLLQEMNREANTIGSKCSEPEVSQTVVDLKVAIEQMREQAQNIE